MPIAMPLPDLAATEALGARIAGLLRPGDAVLLEGELGAGKTALARAILRSLVGDPALEVPSPSYTLVQGYPSRVGLVQHFDLWRLEGSGSVVELGWEEARDGVVVVEWPDRLGALRPEGALTVLLTVGDRACGLPHPDPFPEGEEEARTAVLSGWAERFG